MFSRGERRIIAIIITIFILRIPGESAQSFLSLFTFLLFCLFFAPLELSSFYRAFPPSLPVWLRLSVHHYSWREVRWLWGHVGPLCHCGREARKYTTMLGVLQFGLNIEILIRQICHINYATDIDLNFKFSKTKKSSSAGNILFFPFSRRWLVYDGED